MTKTHGMATLTALALAALLATTARAQDEAKATSVVKGLNNPCGVAIQPETGTIFVADSGALKVVKIEDGKAVDVITDFPKDVYGKGPMFDIGPLGLLFLNKTTLVVGGGGQPDGEELLRVYELGDEPIKADAMKASFKLAAEGEEIKGEGNFYALATSKDGDGNVNAIYVTANGDDTKGWVAKADVNGAEVGPFARSIATKEATNVDAPVGITATPEGNIAVGQMGEITVPNDSLLTYYEPATGKMLANYKTNLSDITAVAYSPGEAPQLYALDFAWADTSQGGLFQIVRAEGDGDTPSIEAIKLLSLEKPTAMVFDADGNLYVTIIGKPAEGAEEGAATGELLKIELPKEEE